MSSQSNLERYLILIAVTNKTMVQLCQLLTRVSHTQLARTTLVGYNSEFFHCGVITTVAEYSGNVKLDVKLLASMVRHSWKRDSESQ